MTALRVLEANDDDAADDDAADDDAADDDAADDDAQKVMPPHAQRRPGRPPKRRIRNGVEGPFGGKRQKRCSRCNELGYTIVTCDSSI